MRKGLNNICNVFNFNYIWRLVEKLYVIKLKLRWTEKVMVSHHTVSYRIDEKNPIWITLSVICESAQTTLRSIHNQFVRTVCVCVLLVHNVGASEWKNESGCIRRVMCLISVYIRAEAFFLIACTAHSNSLPLSFYCSWWAARSILILVCWVTWEYFGRNVLEVDRGSKLRIDSRGMK